MTQKVLSGASKPIDETLITRGELHALRLAELLIKEAKDGCDHCLQLIDKIQSHHCDRCFKEVDRLQLNKRYGSDFQLCDFCMEHD